MAGKTTIIHLVVIIVIAASASQATAQSAFEGVAGHNYIFYQHNVNGSLGSGFGVKHIVNLTIRYNTDPEKGNKPNEIMNQGYLSWRASKIFTLLAGVFYSLPTDYRPAAAIQYAVKKGNWLLVLMPRADLVKNGAFDLFGLLEYKASITPELNLYTRLQAMSNMKLSHHNRSYQQFRLGIDRRHTQFGFAMHLDEYKHEGEVHINVGIFFRKEVFP